VYAVDLSATAVAYATANAAAHGVQDAVVVLQGSWCEPLAAALQLQDGSSAHNGGSSGSGAAAAGRQRQLLGGLLSNPPYIPRGQLEAGLQAEVQQHEPLSALDGGPAQGLESLAVSQRARAALRGAAVGHAGTRLAPGVDAADAWRCARVQVICEQAVGVLAPGGFLCLETAGAEQAPLVQQLLQALQAAPCDAAPGNDSSSGGGVGGGARAFADVRVHGDCYGVPRFVTATRTAA
jgi:methylase of polypeptide subunit release factors